MNNIKKKAIITLNRLFQEEEEEEERKERHKAKRRDILVILERYPQEGLGKLKMPNSPAKKKLL